MPQEVMELQAANLRLRGVVADMRREMEGCRDPGVSGDRGGRERRLGDENEDLRSAKAWCAIRSQGSVCVCRFSICE